MSVTDVDSDEWMDDEVAYRGFCSDVLFATPLEALLHDKKVTDGEFDLLDFMEKVHQISDWY